MKRVIALGFFDGVHIGHGALLEKTKQRAAELEALPSVLSFDIHPDTLVLGKEVPLITDTTARKEIINRCYGIENVIFIHFSKSLMSMPWEEFAASIVSELEAVHIVCGHDFTFGNRGEGKAELLKRWCEERSIGCDIIPAVKKDGQIVSSTHIRDLISSGRIEEANSFLGHPHCVSDTVHSGYHIGHSLGAPTINMYFGDGVVVPKYGVYATKVVLENGEEHGAVSNVGVRPTFGSGNKVNIESHLLDFSGNLYNKPARIDFYSFIREERKFSGPDELSGQIQKDIEDTKKYFELHSNRS